MLTSEDFPTLRGINLTSVCALGVKAGQMEAKGSVGEGALREGSFRGLKHRAAS